MTHPQPKGITGGNAVSYEFADNMPIIEKFNYKELHRIIDVSENLSFIEVSDFFSKCKII